MSLTTKTFNSNSFPQKDFSIILEGIYTESVLKNKLDDLPYSDYMGKTVIMYEDDNPLATCTLFTNSGLIQDEKKIGFIGFFESLVQDCKVLFDEVELLAKKDGIQILIGPVNGSTWENYRFTEMSDFPLFLGEPQHPDRYIDIWKASNFIEFASYNSSLDSLIETKEDRLEKIEEKFKKEGLKFRKINMEEFDSELIKLYDFCKVAFENNFLYSPIPIDRFKQKYAGIKSLIDPRFVLFAVNEKDDLLGFILGLPNYYNKNEKQLIVKTIARYPEVKFHGLGNVLGSHLMMAAQENNFDSVIHAFMHEKNTSNKVSALFNGNLIRRYILLSKNIENEKI